MSKTFFVEPNMIPDNERVHTGTWTQRAKETYELWNKQRDIIRAWSEPYALKYGDTWEFVVMSHSIINRDGLDKCINLRTNTEMSLDNH